MSSAGASAGDRHAGLRAARVPAGLGAAPNSSTQSMGDPPAVANGRGNRRYRGHGRRADAGARIAAICYGRKAWAIGSRRKWYAQAFRMEQPMSGVFANCPMGFVKFAFWVPVIVASWADTVRVSKRHLRPDFPLGLFNLTTPGQRSGHRLGCAFVSPVSPSPYSFIHA
jgi:hypothetical protein